MTDTNFKIDGITCPACVKLIEKRLSKIGGVHSVEVAQNGSGKICGGRQIELDEIAGALSDTEYKVS